MNTEPTRPVAEAPPEIAESGSFELSADEEAGLSQITSPRLRGHLRSIRQGIARKEQARAEAQAREPEEKPFVLPLMDEEEIAQIADPRERERKRLWKIDFYKQRPEVHAHYMERSEKIKAERKKLLRLPIIPQETRPAVNVIANSALFAAVQGKDRQLLNDAHLDTQDGVEIIFSGILPLSNDKKGAVWKRVKSGGRGSGCWRGN